MKTYCIYCRKFNDDQKPITDFRVLPTFSGMRKTFAEGAMAMASAMYGDMHEFVCKCEQDHEILSSVRPRKIYLN